MQTQSLHAGKSRKPHKLHMKSFENTSSICVRSHFIYCEV